MGERPAGMLACFVLRVADMNAIELLQEQHADVDSLFARLEKAEGTERRTLFEELADKLAAHAKIEEKLFYPSVMAKQTEELLLESVEEHLSVKRVLTDLMKLDPDDPHFKAKISVLEEQVRHHAHDEEEGELFPKVSRLMSADELEGLGSELLRMFEELLPIAPRRAVPGETGKAADLPQVPA
jgi:hemerythrin superfamily protein